MTTQDTQSSNPDFEFDGLVTTVGDTTVPCEVLVWLPRRPDDDAKIEITLRQEARSVDLRGRVRLRSAAHVERMGLRFEADDILVRDGTSNPLRSNAARLKLTHVGRFRIEHLRVKNDQTSAQPPQEIPDSVELANFKLVISSLSYGGQHATPTAHYLGHRNLKFEGIPKSLRFYSPAETHTFELQRHWTWKSSDKGYSVCGTSAPILVLTAQENALTRGRVPIVTQLGEDACTLLSLAARHRVVPHIIKYAGADFRFEEWRNPLSRHRAITEEEAMGPLVDPAELDGYFECAGRWWGGLNSDLQDAVRLAIFGVHRLTVSTMESDFLGKFAALEGLAKRWGKGRTAHDKFDSLLKTYPIHIGGLWPVFESVGGEPLYWLRNEIAHGRTVMRFSEALPIATDHLQLWLEHILLALMGYKRISTKLDWLAAHVPLQRTHVATLRQQLHEQSQAVKS